MIQAVRSTVGSSAVSPHWPAPWACKRPKPSKTKSARPPVSYAQRVLGRSGWRPRPEPAPGHPARFGPRAPVLEPMLVLGEVEMVIGQITHHPEPRGAPPPAREGSPCAASQDGRGGRSQAADRPVPGELGLHRGPVAGRPGADRHRALRSSDQEGVPGREDDLSWKRTSPQVPSEKGPGITSRGSPLDPILVVILSTPYRPRPPLAWDQLRRRSVPPSR